MNKTHSAIENYINGNLTDAKDEAKRLSFRRLCDTLINDYGKSRILADAIAGYLKGLNSFQSVCEVEARAEPPDLREKWLINRRGELCGLCDGTHEHTHPKA